jgi:DNA-directed RNA polymerase specialized sigma24 family protein
VFYFFGKRARRLSRDLVEAVGFANRSHLPILLIPNFHNAEDMAQNVFIEGFLHLHRLQDPAKFAPWLRRLAINLCEDRLRLQDGRCRLRRYN